MAFCMLHVSVFANSTPKVILKAGTAVELELLNTISSEFALPGTSVDFRVVNDIEADGQVVVKAGQIVSGQVINASKSKAIGKPGYVEIKINSIKSENGKSIYLTQNNLSREGKDKTALSIVLGVVICLLFLLIKGENASIPAGERILTYTAGDTIIS